MKTSLVRFSRQVPLEEKARGRERGKKKGKEA